MISETQSEPCCSGRPGAYLLTWYPPVSIQELALEEVGLIDELIQSYTADMQIRLQRVRVALRSGNSRIVRTEVHTIKGSSRQMGADRVAAICEEIESALLADGPLTAPINRLEAGISEVCEAMAWYQRS